MRLWGKKGGEGKKLYALAVLQLCAWVFCAAPLYNWDQVKLNYTSKLFFINRENRLEIFKFSMELLKSFYNA